MKQLEEVLQNAIEGEVHFDAIHKAVYSVDASIYEIEPIAIILPKNIQDILKVLSISKKFNIPVISRGAATGITGGCLGKGIILDFSKYLNKILEINFKEEYVICEPGVIQDRLNEALLIQGYRLGPDTSTGNRATIGGMFANNAAGSRSLLFGSMKDHVIGLEMALSDGKLLNFSEISQETWRSSENTILKKLYLLKEEFQEEIKEHFPVLPRRSSGYNLDALTSFGNFNPCKLLTGSEGTLGIATKIKLRIVKNPLYVGLCILHFDSLKTSMHTIASILTYHPIALELIDHFILEAGKKAPSIKNKLNWLEGSPEAIFVAEFTAPSSNELEEKLNSFKKEMNAQRIGYKTFSTTDPLMMNQIWELRKSGLGLLLSKRSYSRSIAFIEDLSISPENLPQFMEEFLSYLKSKDKEAGIYGHVGSGCMHIRPFINLKNNQDIVLMKEIMLHVSSLVYKYKGALSGEHGDGLVRSWLNEKMFGKKLYQAFLELKSIFDPFYLMNPGKIVQSPEFLENQRMSPQTQQAQIETFQDFSKEGGFNLAVDLCNGNGLCRKAEKTMCPSFQVTNDEFHTTRARAQSLRAIINGRLPIEDFTSKGLYEVMDLCLECKGCKTECPSEVDMAKMKSEFLYHYYKKHKAPLRNWIFGNIGLMNQLGIPFSTFTNWISKTKFFKFLLKNLEITTEREFPQLAKERFTNWAKKHLSLKSNDLKTVVLLSDTFTEFNEPKIGIAAAKVLENLGYQAIVLPWLCCGRPSLSKGRLPQAKLMAEKLIDQLLPFALKEIPIIGLEPSCLLTIKEDYESLVKKNLSLLKKSCITFDAFIANHLEKQTIAFLKNPYPHSIKLHGHCHQKSLIGTKPTLTILKQIPKASIEEIPSGCCGMAGSFGYEKEHYALSMKIGGLILFPEIKKSSSETTIISDGFSCRHQIKHGTDKKALHLAEFLSLLLEQKQTNRDL